MSDIKLPTEQDSLERIARLAIALYNCQCEFEDQLECCSEHQQYLDDAIARHKAMFSTIEPQPTMVKVYEVHRPDGFPFDGDPIGRDFLVDGQLVASVRGDDLELSQMSLLPLWSALGIVMDGGNGPGGLWGRYKSIVGATYEDGSEVVDR